MRQPHIDATSVPADMDMINLRMAINEALIPEKAQGKQILFPRRTHYGRQLKTIDVDRGHRLADQLIGPTLPPLPEFVPLGLDRALIHLPHLSRSVIEIEPETSARLLLLLPLACIISPSFRQQADVKRDMM